LKSRGFNAFTIKVPEALLPRQALKAKRALIYNSACDIKIVNKCIRGYLYFIDRWAYIGIIIADYLVIKSWWSNHGGQIMTKILVIYYSQSGSVRQMAESLLSPLKALSDVEITWQKISPEVDYNYPWKLYQFFDVFPECVNQEAPAIKTPNFEQNEQFDLVVVAYQVWYLAPSLPIQGFFKSEYAKVLKDTKIITLIGCRNMWHSASEIMKKMIKEVGGIHIDNIVVTHQGSPLATFITTPRMVLTGKKDSLMGVLPPGGFRDEEIDSLSRFGEVIAKNIENLGNSSLLKKLESISVNRRYIIPEQIGRTLYRPWAKLARLFGVRGSWTRAPIIILFALQLVLLIPVVLLISALINLLFSPLLRTQLDSYVQILKSTASEV
jgi:hypothetical protein